jgi:hypothetical protein
VIELIGFSATETTGTYCRLCSQFGPSLRRITTILSWLDLVIKPALWHGRIWAVFSFIVIRFSISGNGRTAETLLSSIALESLKI